MGPFKHTVDDGLDIRKVNIFVLQDYRYTMVTCARVVKMILSHEKSSLKIRKGEEGVQNEESETMYFCLFHNVPRF